MFLFFKINFYDFLNIAFFTLTSFHSLKLPSQFQLLFLFMPLGCKTHLECFCLHSLDIVRASICVLYFLSFFIICLKSLWHVRPFSSLSHSSFSFLNDKRFRRPLLLSPPQAVVVAQQSFSWRTLKDSLVLGWQLSWWTVASSSISYS